MAVAEIRMPSIAECLVLIFHKAQYIFLVGIRSKHQVHRFIISSALLVTTAVFIALSVSLLCVICSNDD